MSFPLRSACAAFAVLAACVVRAGGYEYNDAHVHLTDYIQEGPPVRDYLKVMAGRVGRSTLFGIPLQQFWSYRLSGEDAPKYYLDTDAPLYYYSFTDAYIATAFQSLSNKEKARFDPMITGFNPADMYAADHVRRVLKAFPGVFAGVGEFTIHKEFVSSKVSGEVASLQDPALDRLFDFCGETGLVVLIHNDVDRPFAKTGEAPVYLTRLKALFKRHPKTTIIWAHTGLGRVIHPIEGHAAMLESIIQDPGLSHVHFDISWDEVAKYVVASEESLKITADLLNRHPDRFLFGSDEVSPSDPAKYFRVYGLYDPLWKRLTPEASRKIRLTNYERIFDQAKKRVRAWEKENVNER